LLLPSSAILGQNRWNLDSLSAKKWSNMQLYKNPIICKKLADTSISNLRLKIGGIFFSEKYFSFTWKFAFNITT
jgi:hypothetical protein